MGAYSNFDATQKNAFVKFFIVIDKDKWKEEGVGRVLSGEIPNQSEFERTSCSFSVILWNSFSELRCCNQQNREYYKKTANIFLKTMYLLIWSF